MGTRAELSGYGNENDKRDGSHKSKQKRKVKNEVQTQDATSARTVLLSLVKPA